MDYTPNYQCTYCHKAFVAEERFLQHKCEMMVREDEIKTPAGQAAWLYFQKWLKTQKKSVSEIRQFINSKRYYRSFIRFAEFVQRVHLADIEIFIKLMNEKRIPPQLWTNDEVYSLYLQHLDHVTSPIELGEKTANFIHQIAEVYECPVGDTFDQLQPGDIMQYIRERRFTPWLLLRSKRFGKYLRNLNEDERKQFGSLIKREYWEYKFNQNPEIVKWMDTKVKELNI
jgi:hypothetical protein